MTGGQHGDMISSYRFNPLKEKVEIQSETPDGMVKVIALQTYAGMVDMIFEGEVFMLPARRFHCLAKRGFVEEYSGDKRAINKR
jgi:hypothetical protein